jgi:hypothetical protein
LVWQLKEKRLMETKHKILFLICTLLVTVANSQNYIAGDNYKLGLKAGPVAGVIYGNALTKAYPGYGFTGGVYLRAKLKNGFHFQTELSPTIRNSKYGNHATNGYEKISLFYIDANQMIMKDLKKGSHEHCLLLGLQPSVLIQSWVYNSYYQLSPAARDIKLNTIDVSAVIGYQYNRKIIGIQSVLKFGLTNINRGLNMHDHTGNRLGPTNDEGIMRNFSWETTISF